MHLLLAFKIDLLRPFTTSKNKKVERGQICLRPLVALKKLEGDPFIRATNDADP